jgi:drug/metabolite transporter (DMT)-like permease
MIAATLWGVSGVVAKLLFNAAVDPLNVVAVRLTLSAVLLFAILALVSRRRLRVTWQQFVPLVVLGAFAMATNQAAYFYAISATSVAVAVFLQ